MRLFPFPVRRTLVRRSEKVCRLPACRSEKRGRATSGCPFAPGCGAAGTPETRAPYSLEKGRIILEVFLQQLVNGVSLGSIYALVALGYTMVYGIIKLINFAHCDIYPS